MKAAVDIRRAVFLDRDGILIRDDGVVSRLEGIDVLPGVPSALKRLKEAGLALPVVSNQSVVARGVLTESEVKELQAEVERRILQAGGPALDGFYFCPHHPKGTLEAYRSHCDCRKPGIGLLTRAAGDLGVDLQSSFMVGDRPTDIVAGRRAGCRTVWVQTGQHAAPLIETAEPMPADVQADHVCADLAAAVDWILSQP
ncbi:MAG: HAD family hydrolase [Verrucomicrobiales bacterium]|nr:HAD family hydrolase [Verrucomicrobiales bacterium]